MMSANAMRARLMRPRWAPTRVLQAVEDGQWDAACGIESVADLTTEELARALGAAEKMRTELAAALAARLSGTDRAPEYVHGIRVPHV